MLADWLLSFRIRRKQSALGLKDYQLSLPLVQLESQLLLGYNWIPAPVDIGTVWLAETFK